MCENIFRWRQIANIGIQKCSAECSQKYFRLQIKQIAKSVNRPRIFATRAGFLVQVLETSKDVDVVIDERIG